MDGNIFYGPGLLYDGFLEPALNGIRKKVRSLIIEHDLFPVLDLCCGPGAQLCRLTGQGGFACGLDINLAMLKYAAGRRPGIPFVCANAADAPFGPAAFKGIILSFSLHEKRASLRPLLLAEARRLLRPEGRIVLVDFERPWNKASKLAYLYVWIIERLAGKEHFSDGREFLKTGGLRALLRENGLEELDRHNVSAGTCAVVLAAPR